MYSRLPRAALQPFVKTLWATCAGPSVPGTSGLRERVLPTGAVHLVIRLSGSPLRLYDTPSSEDGRVLGHAVVGGPRTGFYVRDVSSPAESVGALLYPGAAPLLLGVPAEALAERHTPLDALWGGFASELTERLHEAQTPEARLSTFESLLLSRLRGEARIAPVLSFSLGRLASGVEVGRVVDQTGYSHRHFIALFREAVGMAPKQYARVVRFGAALERLAARGAPRPGDVAADAGYSDQAHFHRDFRAFTGLSPGEYQAAAPLKAHHVPIRSNSFKTLSPRAGTFPRE
ncbi:AraC family transcriptional regulator [Pyxidicoccus xibeiensis]|uniref:AraC family transcriptional regulator n=1 Tax=Pyxidicoccus xibeiensis TaxID=2906759 RepID=UPI0020A7443F|nr:helix-turn-helix domain-containing protein [Pyxidicoccus xibeiensis]MCP3140077.1 helix-turn-helix domain-containing protein [Pyxidicoccus xibeiensis]